MPHQFSLSLAALDILLEQLKLGRAPAPFEVRHLGITFTERAGIRAAVLRDLEAKGIVSRGRLDPDVELALRTFVHGPVAIMAVAQLEGEQLFARSATDGHYGVVVKQDKNSLVFTDARPTAIVPGVVDLLPRTPAAGGQSVTVARPKRAKRRSGENSGYDPFANVSRPRSASSAPSQLRMVERIFGKPKLRIGQFTADVHGRRLTPTAWFDTEEGRYFVTSRDAEDGQSWVTYAPADNARIGNHLFEQVQPYVG